MICIVPEHIKELFDKTQFDAAMQKYNPNGDVLTDDHRFIKEYLQPLLEKIENSIADQSNRAEEDRATVIVKMYNPKDGVTCSEHDHKYNTIVICIDTNKQDWHKQAANDIRHESEHANQGLGDGYSIDQRTLVKLSRLSYHPGNDALYYNNFNEIRARLAEFKMHQALHEELVQQNAPFEQRQQTVRNLAAAESHLTHHLSQKAQEQWMTRAQQDIQSIWRRRDREKLLAIFPDAKNIREAKQMAIAFLQQKAPEIFEELRAEIKAYSEKTTEVMMAFEDERKEVQKQEACKDVFAHEKAKDMPVLTTMPQPTPLYRFEFTDPSQVDIIMSGDTITLYNRALVQQNGRLYLVGDTSDIYRDYAHPRPAGLTPEAVQPEEPTEGFIDFNTLFQTEEKSEEDLGDEEPGWGD